MKNLHLQIPEPLLVKIDAEVGRRVEVGLVFTRSDMVREILGAWAGDVPGPERKKKKTKSR